MNSTYFFMSLLVVFGCTTLVAAAPAIYSNFDSPIDLMENVSTDIYNDNESNYSPWSDCNTEVTYEPASVLNVTVNESTAFMDKTSVLNVTVNDSTPFIDNPFVFNVTVNDSTAFMDKPSVLNVTDNACETTMDINTATEFNTYDLEANSTVIVVTPNSNPTGMDYIVNTTNLKFNDITFTTYKPESNLTINGSTIVFQPLNSTDINESTTYEPKINFTVINGMENAQRWNFTSLNDINSTMYESKSNSTVSSSTIAYQQSNSTTSENVLTYEPELNYTINYLKDTMQQLNDVNNNTVNSMNLSANAEIKPNVTNTSIVADEYAGLQMGYEESTSNSMLAIIKRSIIQIPIRMTTKVFWD